MVIDRNIWYFIQNNIKCMDFVRNEGTENRISFPTKAIPFLKLKKFNDLNNK